MTCRHRAMTHHITNTTQHTIVPTPHNASYHKQRIAHHITHTPRDTPYHTHTHTQEYLSRGAGCDMSSSRHDTPYHQHNTTHHIASTTKRIISRTPHNTVYHTNTTQDAISPTQHNTTHTQVYPPRGAGCAMSTSR